MPSAMVAEKPQTMAFRTPVTTVRRPGALHGLPPGENCAVCRMQNQGFFCRMSDPATREWDRIKHVTSYPEGALLCMEGEAARGVHVLCQGRVKLLTTNSEGKTFIMKIAQAGQVFGLNSIVTGRPHEVTVETMQPCTFSYVNKEDFLRFIHEYGDACMRVVQQLGQECHSAYEVIRALGLASSVSEKLAKFLLGWSAEGKESAGAVRVKLALTHEELAQLIGCSRESVTRTLSDFKRQKLVELNGSTLLVWNKPGLESLAAM
ncbi:MAG TPA: Crp/Fnr family transcriptional regulator [Candidatus Eisenbacteria bacterium]|nr:Crp/Fnr family transcriptional regulator [Candidatus Eisenbacteria bacterium]